MSKSDSQPICKVCTLPAGHGGPCNWDQDAPSKAGEITRDPYDPRVLLCRLQDALFWVETATYNQCLTRSEKRRTHLLIREMRDIYGECRVIPASPHSGGART